MLSTSVWQLAQVGFERWTCNRSRVEIGFSSVTGGSVVLTPAGGGGTTWQRKCSRTKSPRSVGEVSAGLLVSARNVAWPRTPARADPAANSTRSQGWLGLGTPYSLARSGVR